MGRTRWVRHAPHCSLHEREFFLKSLERHPAVTKAMQHIHIHETLNIISAYKDLRTVGIATLAEINDIIAL